MAYNAVFAGGIDVTLVLVNLFVAFFLGLVLYLRREDRREGYPLEDDVTGRLEPAGGLFFTAEPKTFILPHGEGVVTAPDPKRDDRDLAAQRTGRAPGLPIEPTTDDLGAGVGPGGYALRKDVPDLLAHGEPKIVPLRAAPGFSIDGEGPNPIGMTVMGCDGRIAGTVSDVWIDRGEYLIRYLEVELPRVEGFASRRVLAPMPMAVVHAESNLIEVDAIRADQFDHVPGTAHHHQITFLEEERIAAYFGAGYLYAKTDRAEPLI